MTARNKPLQQPEPLTVRLKSLHIENYKGIDSLEISFPGPGLKTDPRVTVIGSENGIGKTSILECCALLFLSLSDRRELRDFRDMFHFMHFSDLHLEPYRLMIRAGAKCAQIRGQFSIGGVELPLAVSIQEERISVEPFTLPTELSTIFSDRHFEKRDETIGLLLSLLGISGEPMVFPPFLYFNSYRKIQEGNHELGMMLSGEPRWRRYQPESFSPISSFKSEIVRALMGTKGLFESVNETEAATTLQSLNSLLTEYAKCSLAKLREDKRGVELRVKHLDSESNYPFDALSSGQKEVVATLFMIWKYTHKQPGIVLIDEPELHLNAEWHRSFIRQLGILQPQNQYIIATHSEHVFDSVDERNRLLLRPSKK